MHVIPNAPTVLIFGLDLLSGRLWFATIQMVCFCVPCFHWLKICEKTTWHTYTQFMSKQMVKNSKNNFNAWYCCGIHSQMPFRYCEGTTFRSVEHIVQKHLWFQTLALLHDSIVRTYVGTKSCLRNGGTVWLDRRFDIGAHIAKWWW